MASVVDDPPVSGVIVLMRTLYNCATDKLGPYLVDPLNEEAAGAYRECVNGIQIVRSLAASEFQNSDVVRQYADIKEKVNVLDRIVAFAKESAVLAPKQEGGRRRKHRSKSKSKDKKVSRSRKSKSKSKSRSKGRK